MKKQIRSALAVSAAAAAIIQFPATAKEETFTVGVCQFVQHEALDASTRGFQAALAEKLGDRVVIDVENAQGDYAACTSVINGFVSKDVDLILANATAALQAAATATSQIPILGTSVTDYGAALQIDDFDGNAIQNVSGTSDLAPLDEQAAMIQELFPDASQVGLLYCSGEPNSQYQIDIVQSELDALGYSCRQYAFSDSNDISAVTQKAAADCDVLYVPTDNTVASNAELIANICIPEQIPVIAGEESTCKNCGVATLSIDYYDLGYTTGEMAARILDEGRNVSEMPIEYAHHFTKRYNASVCEQLGIQVPDDYAPLEAE